MFNGRVDTYLLKVTGVFEMLIGKTGGVLKRLTVLVLEAWQGYCIFRKQNNRIIYIVLGGLHCKVLGTKVWNRSKLIEVRLQGIQDTPSSSDRSRYTHSSRPRSTGSLSVDLNPLARLR